MLKRKASALPLHMLAYVQEKSYGMCRTHASAIQVAVAFDIVPKVPGVYAPLLLIFLVLGSTPVSGSHVRQALRTVGAQRR